MPCDKKEIEDIDSELKRLKKDIDMLMVIHRVNAEIIAIQNTALSKIMDFDSPFDPHIVAEKAKEDVANLCKETGMRLEMFEVKVDS